MSEVDGDEVVGVRADVLAVHHEDVGYFAVGEAERWEARAGAELAVAQELGRAERKGSYIKINKLHVKIALP